VANCKGLLVAGHSKLNSGVWLINLTSPAWKQVIGLSAIKAYLGTDTLGLLDFRLEISENLVKLIVKEAKKNKKNTRHQELSSIEVGNGTIIYPRILAEIDLTSNLLDLGLKLYESQVYCASFITQYSD
jgi:hypothetical protein